MDDTRFDRLTQVLSQHLDRRRLSRLGVGALGIAGGIRAAPDETEARKRKKCPSGLLTCKLKRGKKKAQIFCKDGQTDPFNCGACGNTCATGQNCQGGVCTCNGTLCTGCCDGNTCQAGNANQRCGVNGAVCQNCTGGSSCQNGVCTCPAGLAYCGGACVDTRTDAANCGACGTVCTLPRTCGGGNPGTPGVCGCTKLTCQAGQCGNPPDGCGGTLNCGACGGGASGNETCGGGGVANVCGCRANGFVFPFEEDNFNCDPCCSGDCCFVSPGLAECAGGCG